MRWHRPNKESRETWRPNTEAIWRGKSLYWLLSSSSSSMPSIGDDLSHSEASQPRLRFEECTDVILTDTSTSYKYCGVANTGSPKPRLRRRTDDGRRTTDGTDGRTTNGRTDALPMDGRTIKIPTKQFRKKIARNKSEKTSHERIGRNFGRPVVL